MKTKNSSQLVETNTAAMNPNIVFVTIGTRADRLEYLLGSCADYGGKDHCVRLGEEGMEWKGMGMKSRLTREWLEHAPIDENTWIVLNDGYDTACQQPLERITEVLSNFDPSLLLVSAELYPWPQPIIEEALERFGPVDGTYKFPCAGQYAGTRRSLIHLYDTTYECDEVDDQLLMHQYCAQSPERVQFDTEHILFHANLFRLRNDVIEERKKKFETRLNHDLELRTDSTDGRVKFHRKDTGVAACFVHANGSRVGIDELHRTDGKGPRSWLPW